MRHLFENICRLLHLVFSAFSDVEKLADDSLVIRTLGSSLRLLICVMKLYFQEVKQIDNRQKIVLVRNSVSALANLIGSDANDGTSAQLFFGKYLKSDQGSYYFC